MDEQHETPIEARQVRSGARRIVAGGAAAALLLGVLSLVVHDDGSEDAPTKVETRAPAVVLGDIDAVVVATTYDQDGARAPIPRAVRDAIASVPGVQEASGALQTFASLPAGTAKLAPPRSPILFTYHEPGELDLQGGRLPNGPDEVVVNADFLRRTGAAVGATVDLSVQGVQRPFDVVGAFELPGMPSGDQATVPLAAVPAATTSELASFDRIDVTFAPDADPDATRSLVIAAAGGDVAVLDPTELGYQDQRLAQLDIQRAYWDTLDLDPAVRHAANAEPPVDEAAANALYDRNVSQTRVVELRVERIAFLSPDDATLVYRIYYGGAPSPVINDPQDGEAVRVDGRWKLAASTQCDLAALSASPCRASDRAPHPPKGWRPPGTVDPALLTAFLAMTDPDATVEQRLDALAGPVDRAVVEAGIEADRRWHGKVRVGIVGWRNGSGGIQVLYAISTTDGGPSTPYPLTATTDVVDGHLRLSGAYACGLSTLAGTGCPGTDRP